MPKPRGDVEIYIIILRVFVKLHLVGCLLGQ